MRILHTADWHIGKTLYEYLSLIHILLCKKTVGVFLACLVLVSLLLFPSCGQNESILPTDGLPQPTDKLTLYLPPNLIDDFLTHALALFREDFPDVQIEYKTFEGQDALERITNYQSILATDLITGNGPDLVLFHSSDFSDYQKLLRAGHFVNLDDLFTQDADYSTDTFQRAVWDSGRIDGERLFAPLNYSTFVLLSSHEGMQECGISLQASTTFEEWAAAVVEYMKDHAGTARCV